MTAASAPPPPAPSATPEAAPPPSPFASEQTRLTQANAFVTLSFGSIAPRVWTKDEVLQGVPPAARAEFQSVERARSVAAQNEMKLQSAMLAEFACEDCREKAALTKKVEAATRTVEQSSRALQK